MPLSSFDTVEWPAVAATALFLLIAIWAILLWRAISVQQQRQSVDESGERLRLAMGAADIGTFAIDFDEGLVRYTPELAGILGFPNLTVGSLDEAFTRVHRDDAAQVRKHLQAALDPAGAGQVRLDFRFVPPGGEVRWLIWNGKTQFRNTARGRVPYRLIGACVDASDRKRAEQALRESEERFRKLFEHSPVGTAITDWAGQFVRCNPAYLALLGYSADELRQLNFAGLVHPADLDANLVEYDRLKAGEVSEFETENRYLRKDGQTIWVRQFVSVLPGTGGPPTHLIALVTDITRQRQLEEDLRRSREDLHRAQAVAHTGGWGIDTKGFASWVTTEFRRIFGLPDDTPVNYETMLGLVHPDDRARVESDWQSAVLGAPFDIEHRIVVDGQTRWVRERAELEFDATGKLVGGVGTSQDITDRKAIEQALEEGEQLQRALIEGIPQLVWRAKNDGQLMWCSTQWTSYTGLSLEASRGSGWLDAVHPDDQSALRAAWAVAPLLGEMQAECRLLRGADRSYRWFNQHAFPVRDDAGAIVEWMGTSTDIDDLRRMQEQQKVMVAELQHRTRSLLNVVDAIADKLGRRCQSIGEFQEQFGDRLRALSRVQGLLSRAAAAPISIGALVRMELDALGTSLAKERAVLEGPDVVLPEPTLQTLALGLHELATNALKHGALANDSGRMTIRWRVDDGQRGRNLCLEWIETGIEPQQPRATTEGGYGRQLIERALPYALGAKTEFRLGDHELHCTIDLPLGDAEHALLLRAV